MGVSLTMSPIFLPQATLLQHPTALGPRRCSPQFAPDQRILRLVLQRLTPQRQSLHVFPESLKGLGLAIVGLRLGAPRELSHKFPQIMSTVTTIEIYRNVFLEPCCFLGTFLGLDAFFRGKRRKSHQNPNQHRRLMQAQQFPSGATRIQTQGLLRVLQGCLKVTGLQVAHGQVQKTSADGYGQMVLRRSLHRPKKCLQRCMAQMAGISS